MSASPESEIVPGELIAERWALVRKLGEGGMAIVFLARDTTSGALRAIKILRREFMSEEQVVSRFALEAKTAARLVHPNIVRVFEDTITPWGAPCFLMEALDGQSLAEAAPLGRRLTLPRAASIVQRVLVALSEAHRQGVVHRDLKPDNIFLVGPLGAEQAVKLLDFGVARVIEAAGGHTRKTKTGMMLGTPGYMSPEQLRNAKDVDARGDLWSLATVFYELLTGHDPFDAINDFARLTAVFTQDAIDVDRDDASLRPWRPFFERAFAKDLDARFQSADEMRAAVDALLRGDSLPAPAQRRDSPAERPASRVLMLGALLIMVAIVGLLIAALARGGEAPTTEHHDSRPLSSRP